MINLLQNTAGQSNSVQLLTGQFTKEKVFVKCKTTGFRSDFYCFSLRKHRYGQFAPASLMLHRPEQQPRV